MRFSRGMAGAVAGVVALAGGLTGCKVEASREQPGSGGERGGATIRVSPMNREEVKRATNQAVEDTAEAAQKVKNAAVTAGQDVGVAAEAIRARHEAERARSAAGASGQETATQPPQ